MSGGRKSGLRAAFAFVLTLPIESPEFSEVDYLLINIALCLRNSRRDFFEPIVAIGRELHIVHVLHIQDRRLFYSVRQQLVDERI